MTSQPFKIFMVWLNEHLYNHGPMIDALTRCCAVLGSPIKHSASPAMQNAGIRALNLNWLYLALEVLPAELLTVITGAKAMRFIGLNLTLPHKLLALQFVDALDPSAETWGAVNTIRFEVRTPQGEWIPTGRVEDAVPWPVRSKGFNTDASALVRALRDDLKLEPRGSAVLQLGAGGAGRVAALKLASEGASSLHLVNRTPSKAETLAAEIRERFPHIQVKAGYPNHPVDLLLNCTSLGLNPADPLPLDLTRFDIQKAHCVYDMIYNPAETALLNLARQRGCRVANGLGMLLYQGAEALELWSGKTAPLETMRNALEAHVYG